eukprot:187092-Amphidinium_carterae.1
MDWRIKSCKPDSRSLALMQGWDWKGDTKCSKNLRGIRLRRSSTMQATRQWCTRPRLAWIASRSNAVDLTNLCKSRPSMRALAPWLQQQQQQQPQQQQPQ